ncbi:DedA family protein [Marinomonas agarivorans]|nr:DedA family protein [Marinomonas agarivorans]
MFEFFTDANQNPLILMLIIILTSYILEDAAIIGAALLAADSSLPYSLGLIAVFTGIVSGDLILYYLGVSGHKINWVHEKLSSPKGLAIKSRFNHRAFLSVFIIRFIPGLRGIGYLVCGALRVNVFIFLASILFASSIWCGLIYSAIYWLGDALWLTNSPWRWLMAPVLFIILWSANKKINNSLNKDSFLERT